ncbi:hypothetical protein [Hymenobacter profundi]|uniref:Apea-like HEPN domain-containing protein n=1 Tax=Hymenobacter profundi TaxID=1982110 RepID=A0ABS6WWV9_9BACT|nr:hypothetical protein [Hymenobacter profundi]MBW3128071.1 hypothetical protein [Hymenobacter profundi]
MNDIFVLPSKYIYDYFLDQKSAIESSLANIGQHAKAISEYMIAIEIEGWHNLAQWFHIANGIKELNYDGIKYDSAFSMCRPAYEYEIERQGLYHKLITEITLFSYLYSGLEGIISNLDLPKCPGQNGKINAASFYLKSNFSIWSNPIFKYSEIVKLCEVMFQYSFESNYTVDSELNRCVGTQGIGLKLLYKVRNKIMHGDFFFPEPLEHSTKYPFQPEIINLCSRLILMTVQMLLLSCRKGNYDEHFQIYESSIFKNSEDYDLVANEKVFLSNLHLKQPNLIAE